MAMATKEDPNRREGDATGDALSVAAVLMWAIACYVGAVTLCFTNSKFGDPSLDVWRNGILIGLAIAVCSSPIAICMMIVRGSARRLLLLGLGMTAVCATFCVDTTCVATLLVSVLFARWMYGRGAGARI